MPNNTNSLKVKRPINKIPRAHQRSSEEPRNGNSLRVIPNTPTTATTANTGAARTR